MDDYWGQVNSWKLSEQSWKLSRQNELLEEIVKRQRAEASKPKCWACMGRIEAGASICQFCRKDLSWLPILGVSCSFNPEKLPGEYTGLCTAILQDLIDAFKGMREELGEYQEFAKTATPSTAKKSLRPALMFIEEHYPLVVQMLEAEKSLGVSIPQRSEAIHKVKKSIERAKESYATVDGQIIPMVNQHTRMLTIIALILGCLLVFAPTLFCAFAILLERIMD